MRLTGDSIDTVLQAYFSTLKMDQFNEQFRTSVLGLSWKKIEKSFIQEPDDIDKLEITIEVNVSPRQETTYRNKEGEATQL